MCIEYTHRTTSLAAVDDVSRRGEPRADRFGL